MEDVVVRRYENFENYYDLVELPGGSHIPVPIAIQLVGIKEVAKIPVSRKVRNDNFFYCLECDEHSFFKCWEHYEPEIDVEEDLKLKEAVFVSLIRNGKHRKCRYIISIY
ncbi:hypothetical protein Ferp_0517 [Ferroglobus placidus DSM 10642]|uniref:Uncharacterized protein n=1 Tax=Ferroglobus placidus (strain DSM 10642 / AEDII12DO) TaxID=589924 RepID=D3S358_FERPA|nr:hypothetical protein [Ferroglobus placidus]ADC64691.1 hypothetical protein Ferp_0517 [Ferroglobus placidus DSM 10642]